MDSIYFFYTLSLASSAIIVASVTWFFIFKQTKNVDIAVEKKVNGV
jgi:hypothetical protein